MLPRRQLTGRDRLRCSLHSGIRRGLAEYRRYPDTFFGEVLKPGGKCETFVDWCDWLFETYQHTPRETLLKFLAKAKDIEQLRTLDQRDLAIAYCERMAHALHSKLAPQGAEPTTLTA